jgi:DNA-binding LytR/AlgR family response regulator
MKLNLDIDSKHIETSVLIKANQLSDEVQSIVESIKNSSKINIIGEKENRVYILDLNDITHFKSELGKVYALVNHEEYFVKDTLYKLEEQLSERNFARISKSVIVNINYVESIELSYSGNMKLNFKNNHEDYISRRYVSKFKEKLGLGGKS